MTTESKDFEAQLDKLQSLIGKCSQYCVHYREWEVGEMYCEHPDACPWDKYSFERGFGQHSLCPLWEGTGGYCSKHDMIYIEDSNIGCVECWDEYYASFLKEKDKEID